MKHPIPASSKSHLKHTFWNWQILSLLRWDVFFGTITTRRFGDNFRAQSAEGECDGTFQDGYEWMTVKYGEASPWKNKQRKPSPKMMNRTRTHHKTGERKNHQKPNLVWWEVGVWTLFSPGSTSREVPKGKTLTPTCKKSTTGWIQTECSQWSWTLTADMTQATRLSREVCGFFETQIGEGWGTRCEVESC